MSTVDEKGECLSVCLIFVLQEMTDASKNYAFHNTKLTYFSSSSVKNSSNGLIFRKNGQKTGTFSAKKRAKNGQNYIFSRRKNGRFQVWLFPSSLQYLQASGPS
jgi:hypothetical protein